MSPSATRNAATAYSRTARELVDPRALEAGLLLKAAAKLQAALDEWDQKPLAPLSEALLYNRRLWIVLIDAVIREDNALPLITRQNLLNLGVFVLAETFSLMTSPRQKHLENLIRINRDIAAGLGGNRGNKESPRAA